MQSNNASAWIENILEDFPSSGLALYVRGATGYSGPKVGDALSALSPEGSELSYAFGVLLKGRLAGVVSAPGKVNVNTAHCILDGAGISRATLQEDREIGDPSLYVTDMDLAMSEIGNLPTVDARETLLDVILRGHAPWATKDPKSAAQKIQAKLVASIQPGKVTVFVAPSVAIAATVGLALGLEGSIRHADCPTSLQGAAFIPSSTGIQVQMGSYSGRSVL